MENTGRPRRSILVPTAVCPWLPCPPYWVTDPSRRVTGRLLLEGVSLSGRYADMTVPRRMGRVASAGNIRVEDGQITFNERELNFPTGTLRLDDNRLSVSGAVVCHGAYRPAPSVGRRPT